MGGLGRPRALRRAGGRRWPRGLREPLLRRLPSPASSRGCLRPPLCPWGRAGGAGRAAAVPTHVSCPGPASLCPPAVRGCRAARRSGRQGNAGVAERRCPRRCHPGIRPPSPSRRAVRRAGLPVSRRTGGSEPGRGANSARPAPEQARGQRFWLLLVGLQNPAASSWLCFTSVRYLALNEVKCTRCSGTGEIDPCEFSDCN